jgi:hypothetical protein
MGPRRRRSGVAEDVQDACGVRGTCAVLDPFVHHLPQSSGPAPAGAAVQVALLAVEMSPWPLASPRFRPRSGGNRSARPDARGEDWVEPFPHDSRCPRIMRQKPSLEAPVDAALVRRSDECGSPSARAPSSVEVDAVVAVAAAMTKSSSSIRSARGSDRSAERSPPAQDPGGARFASRSTKLPPAMAAPGRALPSSWLTASALTSKATHCDRPA